MAAAALADHVAGEHSKSSRDDDAHDSDRAGHTQAAGAFAGDGANAVQRDQCPRSVAPLGRSSTAVVGRGVSAAFTGCGDGRSRRAGPELDSRDVQTAERERRGAGFGSVVGEPGSSGGLGDGQPPVALGAAAFEDRAASGTEGPPRDPGGLAAQAACALIEGVTSLFEPVRGGRDNSRNHKIFWENG